MLACLFYAKTISDVRERRIFRKWPGIWSGGVFLLIFLPGLLASQKIIPENAKLANYPCLFVVLFIPTVSRYVHEIAAIHKKDNGSEE